MIYETAQDLYDALSEPFPTEYIEWRVGSTNERWRKDNEPLKGKPLCYIDARAVMDRLDSVCGPEGWQNTYLFGPGSSLICNLGIRMPGSNEWLWKADGAGATDVEAEKGAMSDALKRAAVRWGVGRYLYDIDAKQVDLEVRGKTAFIPASTLKSLNEIHDQAAQKVGWGGPANIAAYRFLHKVVEETVTQPSDAEAFREKYHSMFSLLRVAARRHLEQTLERVGSHREAAE